MRNGSSLLPRLHALAASGVGGLRTDSQWEAWLRRAERFAQFGFENTMLIWAQAPDAVLLNTYGGWRRRGRQVIAGSSGIRLIAPGKGGTEHVRTFFDLYQTEGQAVRVPQPRGALEDVGTDGHVWDTLRDLASSERFRVAVTRDARVIGIDWESKIIGVPADGDRVAGLVRQVSRVLVNAVECTGVRKVEADSLAYLISRRFGMDTSAISFPYVTSWAGTDPRTDRARIIGATGDRIVAAASKAFACIDASEHSSARPVAGPRRAASSSAAPDSVAPVSVAPVSVAPVSVATRPEASERSPLLGERARSLALVQMEALRFFGNQVRRSWVPAYLERRGFDAAARRDWGAGYAPGTWTAVTDHLRSLGFADEIIEASGLAKRSSRHTLIDVFRDRAMFPVNDPNGITVGFIGRAAPGFGPGVPKYLNSRETQIYSKGRVLFGLYEGLEALSAGAVPVIVEGPVDAMAITCSGEGRFVGVSPCGTAFTTEQLGTLVRVCDLRSRGVLAAFDADEAGQRAAVRAYGLLSGVANRPMAVAFPPGQDPAGILAEVGPQALRLALDNLARPLADTVIDARLAQYRFDSVDGQFNALYAVAPVIADMPPVEWPRQAIRVSAQIGLEPALISDAVIDAMPGVADPRAGPSPGRAAVLAASDRPGRQAGQRLDGAESEYSAQSPALAAASKGVPRNRPGS